MKVAILGAGGHGKVVLDLLKATGEIEFAGFFDRNCGRLKQPELKIIGSEQDLINQWRDFSVDYAVVAIGDNCIREKLYRQLVNAGLPGLVLIHPRATVSLESRIAPGTVICGHAFIGPGAVIGENCIINTAATVDHDCIVADHVHICPGVTLAGEVKIGMNSMIGTGANIIPGIRVGNHVVVGAGSTVISDIRDNVTVVGIPAHEVAGRKGGLQNFSESFYQSTSPAKDNGHCRGRCQS